MTELTINLFADPNYSVQATLDGSVYRLSFRWISNESAWYFDLEGITDPEIVLYGVKLVCGLDLLEPYGLIGLGELWLINMSGSTDDPGFEDIADDFVLYYE